MMEVKSFRSAQNTTAGNELIEQLRKKQFKDASPLRIHDQCEQLAAKPIQENHEVSTTNEKRVRNRTLKTTNAFAREIKAPSSCKRSKKQPDALAGKNDSLGMLAHNFMSR